jgi:hypothetical protein
MQTRQCKQLGACLSVQQQQALARVRICMEGLNCNMTCTHQMFGFGPVWWCPATRNAMHCMRLHPSDVSVHPPPNPAPTRPALPAPYAKDKCCTRAHRLRVPLWSSNDKL